MKNEPDYLNCALDVSFRRGDAVERRLEKRCAVYTETWEPCVFLAYAARGRAMVRSVKGGYLFRPRLKDLRKDVRS